MNVRRIVSAVIVSALCVVDAAAQQPQNLPHIAYVYPAGVRRGETARVVVGGQRFREGATLLFSGEGLTAQVVEYKRPLTQKEFNDLRMRAQELQNQKKTPEVLAELAEIRKKLMTFNRNQNPALAESLVVEITAAPDAPLGRHEFRVLTPAGVSNPVVFEVGVLPEYVEHEEYDFRNPGKNMDQGAIEVETPVVINGQTLPGDKDRYRFSAKKGQKLVVVTEARTLIPYLADAVPGWFQAVLTLYDADGNKLEFDDDFRFHPDPVLFFEVPEDGEYELEIRDSIFRGREDFVYRVSVGELPFVTNIFPLGAPKGRKLEVHVTGWNLPVDSLTVDTADMEPGIHYLQVKAGKVPSNRVPFLVSELPEQFEQENNNTNNKAQFVPLGQIVNGRIDVPGDWDVFAFDGKKGQKVVVEVTARRLESPVDSLVRIADAKGNLIAANDDYKDPAFGLITHHADSYVMCELPEDGRYYVQLGETQQHGGSEYAYRLRISKPRPDFELRLAPASLTVRSGVPAPVMVYAVRRDGFDGPIDLRLRHRGEGFVLAGGRIPAGADKVPVTLTVPSPRPRPYLPQIEGTATIAGKEISRIAVPAEDMMQAFIYQHLVPAENWMVYATGRFLKGPVPNLLVTRSVEIPRGGSAEVIVRLPRYIPQGGELKFELKNPPEGIAVENVRMTDANAVLTLYADEEKVAQGQAGNLIVAISLSRKRDPGNGAPVRVTVAPIGVLPAIPYRIGPGDG